MHRDNDLTDLISRSRSQDNFIKALKELIIAYERDTERL